jgi:hypothetical protein
MIKAKTAFGKELEFRSAADVLRWLSENSQQHGSHRSVQDYYLGKPDEHGAYWLRDRSHLEISKEDYAHVYRVQRRYRAYVRHMEEVDPEWVDGNKTHWADNSVDVVQHSRKYPGATRRVQLTAPHGDVC